MAPQQQQQQQQQKQQHQQQQNSTFIDDNLDTCPSLLNLPESPILPTKQHQQHGQNQNQDNNNNNNNNKNNGNKPSGERLVDAAPPQHHPLEHYQQNKQQGSRGNGSRRHRHRSISLYGVNSTVEQGHKEIPIWLDDDEPRYVSGVTNKTTCNDIIKALIDDELSNGNAPYCNIIKDGGHGATAASRDYSDYVITERWRGIERSYDGNMAILPVWRAWSRVHNELRLSLKLRSEFKEPLPLQLMLAPAASSNSFSMLKWFKKLLNLKKKKKPTQKTVEREAKVTNKLRGGKMKQETEIPDELLLIILPDQQYGRDGKLLAQTEPSQNMKAKAKLYKLAETRATQRRRQRKVAEERIAKNNANNENYLRRRRKEIPLRQSVRNKLAALHADMNIRYEREYHLTRQLTEKCKQYKLQNELYISPEMEVSVGQLQQNIEAYADEIIKTEHELLELKNEIKLDISLINNLKRMTLEHDAIPIKKKPAASEKTCQLAENTREMQFVDNIYEFCDNNASMLV